jgi:hypothetical protein
VFNHAAVFGINTSLYCPPGTNIPPGMTILTGQNTVAQGQHATWQATAPAGFVITGASIAPGQLYSIGVNDGQGWGGGLYWAGGGAETFDSTNQYAVYGLDSQYFGFQVICGLATCDGTKQAGQITVESINLYATETQGPGLSAPNGLWQAPGWVRGTWALRFSGDSPSGICNLSASINGLSVPGSSSLVNTSVWHQCAAPPVSDSIQTGDYGQGAVPLTIQGTDAAGVTAPYTKTLYIDNSQPTVSFAGPSDAPSTAGTQNVTATASGGPSGIAGLSCSVDGAPAQWSAGSSTSIPISGIGDHTIRCSAAGNAVDGAGNHAWSNPATWTLTIRQPTVSAIGFSKLIDALRCRRVTERITIPAHWVTVHRRHGTIRIRERAHTQSVKVTRCHPRIVHRRITVWVTVKHDGKRQRIKRRKIIRVVKLPHIVNHASRRVGHGRSTVVNGWLGMANGTALSGQRVVVLTAPDNGLGHFSQAAVTTTASNGGWSAQLPPGPSRLVEAVFAGASTLEPTTSAQVHVLVPGVVKLISVSPRRVAWGGSVRIVGRLIGGYLPSGGALVRLRIGFGSSYTTYGVQEHVTGDGRFVTTYTFGLGDPSINRSYWFQIASLPMGNYPWEPAASRRVSVLVGGHPPPPTHRRHRQGLTASRSSRARGAVIRPWIEKRSRQGLFSEICGATGQSRYSG